MHGPRNERLLLKDNKGIHTLCERFGWFHDLPGKRTSTLLFKSLGLFLSNPSWAIELRTMFGNRESKTMNNEREWSLFSLLPFFFLCVFFLIREGKKHPNRTKQKKKKKKTLHRSSQLRRSALVQFVRYGNSILQGWGCTDQGYREG